ncbi:hypothetical protein CEXT_570791 [Caerostris extrusa]|uniref:Secreted protein n=1 Tax=Caerostris extrusa TaxID=172846 RepID=A0AAV4Y1B1_CAEEX|nr:hypothetical protein CEXT_570791 [Caerostris extrusa]
MLLKLHFLLLFSSSFTITVNIDNTIPRIRKSHWMPSFLGCFHFSQRAATEPTLILAWEPLIVLDCSQQMPETRHAPLFGTRGNKCRNGLIYEAQNGIAVSVTFHQGQPIAGEIRAACSE